MPHLVRFGMVNVTGPYCAIDSHDKFVGLFFWYYSLFESLHRANKACHA